MEGDEGGLIERAGPFVHIGLEDLSPGMAIDALQALSQLLEKTGASARSSESAGTKQPDDDR